MTILSRLLSGFACLALILWSESPQSSPPAYPEFVADQSCDGSLKNPETIRFLNHTGADTDIYGGRVKSLSELSDYFSCYERSSALTEAYRETYELYLRAATYYFQVPRSLMGCLLFRESQWDTNAISSKRALGIAQLMPAAIREVNEVLSEDDEIRSQWILYFQAIEHENIPQSLVHQDARDAKAAIAATALYLRKLIYYLNHALSPYAQNVSIDALEYSLFLGASYNMGPTAFSRELRGLLDRDYRIDSSWPQKMGLNRETRDHVLSLRNCMIKDIMDPPANQRRIACGPDSEQLISQR